VLTVDSAEASGVKWAAGGGGSSGAMVLLASATASSSASITFDNEFDAATYASYELRYQGVQPATDNVAFRVFLRSSAPADITDVYRLGQSAVRIDSTFSGNTSNINFTTGIQISGGVGNAANELNSGKIMIMPTAGQWTHFIGDFYSSGIVADRYNTRIAGACEGTTAPAGLRIYMSSGNISIGTFQLYGILK
jgi:hypothetical protein